MLTSPLYSMNNYHFYLTYSADVLENSLPFNCYKDDAKEKNKILEFAYWYLENFEPRMRREKVEQIMKN